VSQSRFGALDLLLVLIVVAWGANLSVIKVALREFPVHAFNALRMVVAGAAFAVMLWRMSPEARRVERGDRGRVVFLGLIGGTFYQMLFVSGVPMTSVANTGLIFGLTPVVVSIFSSVVGHEELPWTRWAGGLLSVVGLYFVVGAGAAAHGAIARLKVDHRAAHVALAARLGATLHARPFADALPITQATLAAAGGGRSKATVRRRSAITTAIAGVDGVRAARDAGRVETTARDGATGRVRSRGATEPVLAGLAHAVASRVAADPVNTVVARALRAAAASFTVAAFGL